MSNEYFQPSSVPAPNSPGTSLTVRQEFANVGSGFDLLPFLAGNANKLIAVDPLGTRLISASFDLNDIVTPTGIQTLTNKTIAWASNTFSGFGNAATKNAGTGAGEVLLLAVSGTLPALDAGNLTNIPGLSLKADANNAVLTGAPVAPTPSPGDNTPRIATTQFVQEAVVATGSFAPSNATPLMDGTASAGTSAFGSRDDHRHPSDTSKAPASAATASGTSFTPTGGVGATDVQAAIAELDAEKITLASLTATNTAFTPTGGVAATNVQAAIAELDSEKATLASPVFTGDPRAPTPASSDNDTSIATTAYVKTVIAQQPVGMQPSNSSPVMNGVVAPGTGVEGSRHDHVHPSDTSRAPSSAATAAGTSFTPTGSIIATNVQAAIAELEGDVTSAATAAGTSFTPTGSIIATHAQAAIAELAGDVTTPNPGQVLQVVTHFDGGADQSASTWVNLTSVAASITPKSANSTLIVECFATILVGNVSGVNAEGVFQIYSGGGPPPTGNIGNYITQSTFSVAGGIGVRSGGSLLAAVSNTDLTPKSYRLAGSPTVGVPNDIGGTQQVWKITEVQN